MSKNKNQDEKLGMGVAMPRRDFQAVLLVSVWWAARLKVDQVASS